MSESSQRLPQRTRLSRNAATRANARIADAVLLERDDDPVQAPEDLLGEALGPIDPKDHQKWKAWAEIESEPAFFNGLLRGLGAEDVRTVEMFTVSQDDAMLLPTPVLGFLFLCRYASEDSEAAVDAPQELWFANQTMANGCATISLLNILMNQQAVPLGANLESLKRETAPLTSQQRGWAIEQNTPLRQAHNSHARRLELLNADLLVSNNYDDCGGHPDEAPAKLTTKRKRGGKAPAPAKPRRKRKRDADEPCWHYKAFVHVLGQVWVLDGLETKPVSLGPATAETWVPLALAGIEQKMAVAGDDMVNILAVCQSPLVALRAELLANLRSLGALRSTTATIKAPGRIYPDDEDIDASLARYGLCRAQLDDTPASEDLGEETEAAVCSAESVQARIMSEYAQELDMIEREVKVCSGRKKDFGPAVHLWVKKLAALGRLQELAAAQGDG